MSTGFLYLNNQPKRTKPVRSSSRPTKCTASGRPSSRGILSQIVTKYASTRNPAMTLKTANETTVMTLPDIHVHIAQRRTSGIVCRSPEEKGKRRVQQSRAKQLPTPPPYRLGLNRPQADLDDSCGWCRARELRCGRGFLCSKTQKSVRSKVSKSKEEQTCGI
jgi:hypothetical protein